MPTQRLGRAATFAFGAAIATSVAGCGTATTGTDSGGVGPAYGAPSDSAMPIDAGNDAAILAMYGGPPVDAGTDTGGPAPAYGAPVFDSGISDEDAGGSSSDYGAPPAP